MKKIFYVLAAALIVAACNQNTPEDPEEEKKAAFAKATLFEALGINTVPSESYAKDSVRVEAVIKGDTAIDIRLYQVSFSSRMPVTIDMVIPDVPCVRTADKITFAGEGINPTMGGNPVSRYVVNDLTGTLTSDSLCFTNSYGQYTGCTYAGKITKMEE